MFLTEIPNTSSLQSKPEYYASCPRLAGKCVGVCVCERERGGEKGDKLRGRLSIKTVLKWPMSKKKKTSKLGGQNWKLLLCLPRRQTASNTKQMSTWELCSEEEENMPEEQHF